MPNNGGSDKFITFIEKELQPYIERTYSTNDSKTIIGQSLDGLLATEILFKNPKLFNHYIIISPSLWWRNAYNRCVISYPYLQIFLPASG